VYGYPKKEAAAVAVRAVLDFLKRSGQISQVLFVCFDAETLGQMQAQLAAQGAA
jgi:O-acetyl-ADP-ribose deacetylase (regulator of RNase III)